MYARNVAYAVRVEVSRHKSTSLSKTNGKPIGYLQVVTGFGVVVSP